MTKPTVDFTYSIRELNVIESCLNLQTDLYFGKVINRTDSLFLLTLWRNQYLKSYDNPTQKPISPKATVTHSKDRLCKHR